MADVDNQITLFREIFETVWQEKAIKDWGELSSFSELLNSYDPFTELGDLARVLPSKTKIKGNFGRKYLWLKSDLGMQPIVHLNFDFSRNIPEVRIRLGLFISHVSSKPSNAFGFRFESPEGIGKHHYYHVQMISGYDKNDDFSYYCPPWLPVKDPTLPLPAIDSVSLLLCFLASLYGIVTVQTMYTSFWKSTKYENIFPFVSFDSLSWYCRLVSQKDNEKEYYYETPHHLDIAGPKLRKLHQNHDLIEITKGDFDKSKEDKRRPYPK